MEGNESMISERRALENLIAASKDLLNRHDDQLQDGKEWKNLAKAVAAAQSLQNAAARTYRGFLQVWTIACAEAAKKSLDGEGVPFDEVHSNGRSDFDVPAITANQYVCVVQALMDAGIASVDWNFAVNNRANRQ
jgi:hypothetical protein